MTIALDAFQPSPPPVHLVYDTRNRLPRKLRRSSTSSPTLARTAGASRVVNQLDVAAWPGGAGFAVLDHDAIRSFRIEQAENADERDHDGSERDLDRGSEAQRRERSRLPLERDKHVAVERCKHDHEDDDGDLGEKQRPAGVSGRKVCARSASAMLRWRHRSRREVIARSDRADSRSPVAGLPRGRNARQ